MSALDKARTRQLTEHLHEQLAELNRATGHTKSILAVDALKAYQAWQIAEVQSGMDEANRGEFATDEHMAAIFEKHAG